MDVRLQVHVEKNTRIKAEREGFWLVIGDELVIFFAAGGEGSRAEAVAAITDRMIEQLMVIREMALKEAVREGAEADLSYVASLGQPPRQLPVDKELNESI